MRWRTRSLVAVGLGLVSSSPAHACGMWINSQFLMVPSVTTVGLGLQSVDSYMIIVAAVELGLGDKIVVAPALGQCRYTGGGDYSELVYGAAVGYQVWKDAAGKVTVNAQAGLETVSADGYTERNIPIGAAVSYLASEMFSIFGGASLNMYSETGHDSSMDPSIFAGGVYKTGKIQLVGGITMYMYDGGSEMAINLGAKMGLGNAASAIKSFSSALRK